MSSNDTPLEYDEEVAFSDYLDARHFVHWHIPQETYTKSWGIKMKNKRQGVRKGPCDHWVIIPTKKGWTMLVAIEMKRIKGGSVSDEQIEFLKAFNDCQGVLGVVCFGADQAIRVVESVENNDAEKIKDIIDYTNSLEIGKSQKNRPKSAKILKNDCPF